MVQMRHQSTNSLKQAKVVFLVPVSNGILPSFWLIRKGKLFGVMAQPLCRYQSRSLSLSLSCTHTHTHRAQYNTMQLNTPTNAEVDEVILAFTIMSSVPLSRWL